MERRIIHRNNNQMTLHHSFVTHHLRNSLVRKSCTILPAPIVDPRGLPYEEWTSQI